MVMSRQQFIVAYTKASVAETGHKASPTLITEGYKTLVNFTKSFDAPNAVPVFRNLISEKTGRMNWYIDSNFAGKLKPTRGYYDPKNDGRTKLAL